MSFPTNIFDSSEQLSDTIGSYNFFEQRIENDVDGNPIYVAWSPVVGANTAEAIWFIKKIYYTAGFITRVQLPDNGNGFIYAWDDRATYFS